MVKTTPHLMNRATPESMGISSQSILDFIDDINKNHIGIHSFTFVRQESVIAQAFWAPYQAETPHVMYSMSKSVTSTAVGFAISEGLLSLDDTMGKLFPERNLTGRNARITVRMLLTMRSSKNISLLVNKDHHDWIDQFFNAPFTGEIDTKFNYISEGTHLLSAIVTKLSGQTLVDYLTPRLFEPLGITPPYWETDGRGNAAGGWGLYMKSEDIAKFFVCYLHNGMYQGQQIIPEFWVREATKKQTDNYPDGALDNVCGYGYQFWRNHLENSFRCDGLMGQRVLFLPDYDAMIVINSGESLDYRVMDAFWRHFPKGFHGAPLAENRALQAELEEKCKSLSMPLLPPASHNLWMEQKIQDQVIETRTSNFCSLLSTSITNMLYNKPCSVSRLRFHFEGDVLEYTWTEKRYTNTIQIGMDGTPRTSKIKLGDLCLTTYSQASWRPDGKLEVWIRPVETAHVRKYVFTFRPTGWVRISSTTEPTMADLGIYYFGFSGHPIRDERMRQSAHKMIETLVPVIEPNFIGRIKK